MNISSWIRNRRTEHRARVSAENLQSFKSSHTNKSIDERSSKLRQSTSRSNANISETRQKPLSSNTRKPGPKKFELTTKNMFKRELNINPKLKHFIENKLKKGVKLQSEFTGKTNVLSTKNKDAKFNMSFVKSVSWLRGNLG
jgi:DNA anti-recombination protein RmuC